MQNRNDDTPVINDYTYYIFEEIEKRGLQFSIPDHWKPLYREFLTLRKQQRKNARDFQHSADAHRSESTRYSADFGNKRTTSSEEDSKTD